jgi:membrane associated rhomboid family serine protease
MQWQQGGFSGANLSIAGFGGVQARTLHMFGDLTWNDLVQGQVWRLVTATFLHASLPHLVLNLIGMIQLGRLVEPWYGARQFLAICLGLGSVGNLVGMLLRQAAAALRVWLQAHGLALAVPGGLADGGGPEAAGQVASVGGSIIILGLCGLSLVVGWRSRTRIGAFLRDQMLAILIFVAVIGIVGMKIIDNYGHAGGAIAGAAAGFLHRRLIRTAPHGWARRIAGLGVVVVLLASTLAQVSVGRAEFAAIRRVEAIREAAVRESGAEVLRQLLEFLRGPIEAVAFDRSVVALVPGVSGGDPARLLADGVPVAFEAISQGLPPVERPPAERATASTNLENLLAEIGRLRPEFDPRLGVPDLDELLDLGTRLLEGSIDPRGLEALRIDRASLARRAELVRDEWRGRRLALEAEVGPR